jgi:hypothetical protein
LKKKITIKDCAERRGKEGEMGSPEENGLGIIRHA